VGVTEAVTGCPLPEVCPALGCGKETSGAVTTPLRGKLLASTEGGTYDNGVPNPTKVGCVLTPGFANSTGKLPYFCGTSVAGGRVEAVASGDVIVVMAPCDKKGSVGTGGAKHCKTLAD